MPSTIPAAVNYWPESATAKAFWTQRELPPYRRLLADTAAWLNPQPGERWLDLGCGGGQLTKTVWEKSGGRLAEVVALDCAAANARAIEKLRYRLKPSAGTEQVRFVCADFSDGLADCMDESFDGVVSGLAIQYAQSWSPEQGGWTAEGYDHVLAEVCRVLRPGGSFVFSVNVPEPAWLKIALYAVTGFFTAHKPLQYLKNAYRMLRYGRWLKREARRGRFHYLPAEVLHQKLTAAGFVRIEHRLSFAGQAYVVRCFRPD
jgi:ubiquinone/menaquinone biosynthesis C-methylase UbiE